MSPRRAESAGLVAIVAALLVPSWWVLPQVLVGLGALSLLSAGCLFWLERLQPLFVVLAVGGVAYQGWLVWRRPGFRRTRLVLAIFYSSLAVTLLVLAGWVWLWLRYR